MDELSRCKWVIFSGHADEAGSVYVTDVTNLSVVKLPVR
jgi:hypothetical protein